MNEKVVAALISFFPIYMIFIGIFTIFSAIFLKKIPVRLNLFKFKFKILWMYYNEAPFIYFFRIIRAESYIFSGIGVCLLIWVDAFPVLFKFLSCPIDVFKEYTLYFIFTIAGLCYLLNILYLVFDSIKSFFEQKKKIKYVQLLLHIIFYMLFLLTFLGIIKGRVSIGPYYPR